MTHNKDFDALYLMCSVRFKNFTIYAGNKAISRPSWKYPEWISEAYYALVTFVGCKY